MIDLGMITNAVALASKAYDVAKKANSLELQETMMSLREAVLEARDETLALRERVRELEAQKKADAEMNFELGVYWKVSDGQKDGPYCQPCWDKDRLAIRVTTPDGDGYWRCKICKNAFDKQRARIR